MKIVIDIPEEDFNEIEPFLKGETIKGGFNLFKVLEIIKNGTPLREILQSMIPTPCRADGRSTTHTLDTIALNMAIKELEQNSTEDCYMYEPQESKEYIEERLENYNKLLKSGILDCVTEKSQESDEV